MTSIHDMTQRRRQRWARLRKPASAEDGMTLVEVVVATFMVGLIAMSLSGLQAAGRTAQDQRVRSQAAALAQQDQERMRGMTADQLAKLSQTRTVTVEGTVFTITSTGTFIGQASGASSCSGAGADYAKVISSVNWSNNKRTAVVEQSVITPPAGGSFLTKTVDQNGAALPGVTSTVQGTDQNTDSTRRVAVSDAEGCAVFPGLTVGDYDVTATRSGYVDPDGNSAPTTAATATGGNTSSSQFTMGIPGAVTAIFSTTLNGVTLTDQLAPSISWFNNGMATYKSRSVASPATAIASNAIMFPFITGGPGNYNGNYAVWAGRCTSATPPAVPSPDARPAGHKGLATVAPGASAGSNSVSVGLPGLIVNVRFRTTATSAFSNVKPNDIRLDFPSDSGTSCGESWHPAISTATGPNPPSTGWLRFPGQPYGPNYTICASYRPASTTYRATATAVANTSYASTGNTVLLSITGISANQGTC